MHLNYYRRYIQHVEMCAFLKLDFVLFVLVLLFGHAYALGIDLLDVGSACSLIGTECSYCLEIGAKSPSQNETSWPSEVSVSTDEGTPSPNPMTWDSSPQVTAPDQITLTATTATDPSGVEYYFQVQSAHPGGDDSGWYSMVVDVDDNPILTGNYGSSGIYTAKMNWTTRRMEVALKKRGGCVT